MSHVLCFVRYGVTRLLLGATSHPAFGFYDLMTLGLSIKRMVGLFDRFDSR